MSITPVYAQIICTGIIQKIDIVDKQKIIEILVEAKDENTGDIKISGLATINLTRT